MAEPAAARVDWLLLLSTVAVAALGLPYLHSAAPGVFKRQVVWILLGFTCMGVAACVDYRLLLRYAYEIYAFALALLALVLLLPGVRGAHSWIKVPGLGFNIQPAELAKLALVLALARNLRLRGAQSTLAGLAPPLLLALLPMALLLKQPDLGSALLLPPLLFAVVFASGARVSHLLAVAGAGLAGAGPMWIFVLKGYQKNRVLAFLHPEQYEAREAYQLLMSLIAIGSGGLWGSGLRNGTLNELDLLPDKHTDFIFGVIAEEGGFAVAGLLLALFLVIVLCCLRIAYNTRDAGGRLVAVGCASLLGSQILVNVGVVTALLPTTGITLPLVSYGGSSMLVTCTMIGLVLGVGARRPLVLHPEPFRGAG